VYSAVFQSPNFGYPKGTGGRGGHEIAAIGLHISGGRWESNYAWIMNPKANASYNAIVRDDGSAALLVAEENAAYSHGRVDRPTWPLIRPGVNPNLYTLSLARTGSNQNSWTPEQLAGTLRVLKAWGKKYAIPLRRPYIFGHFEIDSVGRWYCPGAPFFNRVIAELGADARDPAPAINRTWHRVVAGSFRRADLARVRGEMLQTIGFNPFIARHVDEKNTTWHRVVTGSFLEQENALRQARQIQALGLDTFIAPYRERR